jgi:hypothetical protein
LGEVGESVDSSALLPPGIMAAKMKPIKTPIKRPIVKGIIGSTFADISRSARTTLWNINWPIFSRPID